MMILPHYFVPHFDPVPAIKSLLRRRCEDCSVLSARAVHIGAQRVSSCCVNRPNFVFYNSVRQTAALT